MTKIIAHRGACNLWADTAELRTLLPELLIPVAVNAANSQPFSYHTRTSQ